MVVALDRLQASAPHVESVSLVVAWFGDVNAELVESARHSAARKQLSALGAQHVDPAPDLRRHLAGEADATGHPCNLVLRAGRSDA